MFDDAQPEARTRGLRQVIVGPQMPYFKGGYPMEAPGVGIGNQEQFTYQARAFLDQIAGTPDALPPNASFADGLRSMEIIEAVVKSAQSDGVAVPVPREGGSVRRVGRGRRHGHRSRPARLTLGSSTRKVPQR